MQYVSTSKTVLAQLSVRNVVLIERLELALSPGFNVVTGETGAGKSMLVDALSLVLGGRARPELVRSGADEAEVEALFEVAPSGALQARLDAAGLAAEGELVVRRVVQAVSRASEGAAARQETRSRAYVNGRLCTAAQLAELGADLCDIASQHESVSLTDPSTHVEYLDAFGQLEEERLRLAEKVEALGGVVRELDAASALERGRAEREDFLRWQIREIDELDVREGEEVELEHERARLRHAARLQEATRRAADRLYEGDMPICDELARLGAELDQAASIDGSLLPHARAVESARAELTDAARALARYAEGVEASPERLVEVEERAFRLQKLLRKHGPDDRRGPRASRRAGRRARVARERDRSPGDPGDGEGRADCGGGRCGPHAVAQAPRSGRRSRRRDRQSSSRSSGWGGRGSWSTSRRRRRSTAAVFVDGARLTRTGIDRVEFLIAPNPGEEPRPLRKIASGGELSRALLALKRVLADEGPVGTYVFDEVDAGVGGAIAEVIGRAIADIARHRQVVCITHLPQIAALADTHFVVDKAESKGRTQTTVRRLSKAERVEEIARMLGGIKVGTAQRRAAAEMLRET